MGHFSLLLIGLTKKNLNLFCELFETTACFHRIFILHSEVMPKQENDTT